MQDLKINERINIFVAYYSFNFDSRAFFQAYDAC